MESIKGGGRCSRKPTCNDLCFCLKCALIAFALVLGVSKYNLYRAEESKGGQSLGHITHPSKISGNLFDRPPQLVKYGKKW